MLVRLALIMFRIARIPSSSLRASLARRTYASSTVQLPTQAHGHLPTSQSPITSKLHFFNSVMEEGKQIPTYRILDGSGNVIEGAEPPEVRICAVVARRVLFIGRRWTKPWRDGCKHLFLSPYLEHAQRCPGMRIWLGYQSSTIYCTMYNGKGRFHSTCVFSHPVVVFCAEYTTR